MNKKIVIVIAYKNFQDIEYFIPRNIFLKSGLDVKTVSSRAGIAISDNGNQVEIYHKIEDLNVSDFDAIVFCGGQGALKYLDNDTSYTILREANQMNKIIGAICISPVILAKSGILKDKKATVWSSPIQRSGIKILEKNKAHYIDKGVVIDENIITASGPRYAQEFAKEIIGKLTKNK